MKSSELDIAILRTDEVRSEFVGRHGDYPDMFERLLTVAAEAHEPPVRLQFTTYDARTGALPEPDAHAAYLVTGSRSSVYDDDPWIGALARFLGRALDTGSKVIGICFGHQLIAHYFGGRAGPAPNGWAVGVQESRIVSREPWMHVGDERLNLIASHKDQVSALPEGARVIATSEFCPIGGFVIEDRVLTLQGHPEFERGYSRDLMDMRRELLGEDVYQAGVASLEKETDEMRAAEWILGFLLA